MGIPAQGIMRAANDALARSRLERVGEIQIVRAEEMPLSFHARYDATGKRYRYRIRNAEHPDLFLRNRCYQITTPLDERAMQEAAFALVGEQDFKCFVSAGGNATKTTVRRIDRCTVVRCGEDITIEIEGNGFLYHMVRNIAGTLIEIGAGKKRPQDMLHIIESRDRAKAGHTAPPQGLYLEEVFYEKRGTV
jgi:tRNA pseudouridine38-40 synthase